MGELPLLLRASPLEKQRGSEELFNAAQNDAICLIDTYFNWTGGTCRVAR